MVDSDRIHEMKKDITLSSNNRSSNVVQSEKLEDFNGACYLWPEKNVLGDLMLCQDG